MVVDVTAIGLVRGWAHLDLGAVLKPDVHPLPCGILLRFYHIKIGRVFDCCLEFGFDFRLCFAEDIFVDWFSGFGVATGGIAAFPAAIAPLANTSLTVCSAFCHIGHLLRHTVP